MGWLLWGACRTSDHETATRHTLGMAGKAAGQGGHEQRILDSHGHKAQYIGTGGMRAGESAEPLGGMPAAVCSVCLVEECCPRGTVLFLGDGNVLQSHCMHVCCWHLCCTPITTMTPREHKPNAIKNSITYRQDTSKREGAQSVNQLSHHKVIQKPPILRPTPK